MHYESEVIRPTVYFVFFSRQHILSMAQNFVFSTDLICLFREWRSYLYACTSWKREQFTYFLSLSANFPIFFRSTLLSFLFLFFGCDGSVTETFLYRFREHYKRWIWSISLKHSTKRPSASFWAFCGCMDQLKRLTSFQCRTSIIQGASINTLHNCKKLAKPISIFGGRAYSYVRMARLTTA